MRKEYARAIQRTGKRTLLEASEILFQAVVTRDGGLATPVLAWLTRAPLNTRQKCAKWLAWIVFPAKATTVFGKNEFANHVFSLMQFRLVAPSFEVKHSKKRFGNETFSQTLFSFIFSRRASRNYLHEFLMAMEDLSSEQREILAALIKKEPIYLWLFIDNAWTHELTKEKPDWDAAITILSEAFEAGLRWTIPELSMIAARGIAAIQDEYLNRPE